MIQLITLIFFVPEKLVLIFHEAEIDEEVVEKLHIRARQKGITVSRLASALLRQQLNLVSNK